MREPIIQLAQQRSRGHHPGVILQRYLTCAATGKNGDPEERRALFDAARNAGRSESLREMYADAYTRWNDSFPKDDLNLFAELSTAGRLIVGLGSENVLETGIRLQHTYGVPLIPGSALKGLASHYCHEVWGQGRVESHQENNRLFRRGERYHSLLFGTMDDGGLIKFHDAWINPASLSDGSLRLDVMTPHHPKWQTNDAPPTDFDSPNPVSFLSVAGTFQVRVSWSGPVDTPEEQSQAWTRLAMSLLQEALSNWGVGGKISSGYGRLRPIEEQTLESTGVRPVPSATPAKSAAPRYKRGEKISVTRIEDPAGRAKVRFQADDGISGHFAKDETPPNVPVGNSVEVWVANVGGDTYMLTLQKPTVKQKEAPQGKKGRRR